MCTCVCLPASLLPHIQAFLTQEDLDMSLSVSVRTLDILNHVTLHASVALMCGGVTMEAGWRFAYRDTLNSKCRRNVLASHICQ